MNLEILPFIWVIFAFPALIIFQRRIHKRLQGIGLILTGKPENALILYAIILFPGVLLHEFSHWITAKLFGVRTGSFSLRPKLHDDGTVQLGYVEYYRGKTLDPVRESIIGGAPLIAGTAVILLISLKIFDVPAFSDAVQTGDIDTIILAISDLFNTPFILIWIYLIFAISNGMLPSASDRRAWPAFLIVILVISLIIYFLNLQMVVANGIIKPITTIFSYLSIALSVSMVVNLLFMIILKILEIFLSRIKGVRLVN